MHINVTERYLECHSNLLEVQVHHQQQDPPRGKGSFHSSFLFEQPDRILCYQQSRQIEDK